MTVGRWQPDRHPMSPDIVVVFLFIYLFAVISRLNDYLYFAFILFSFFLKKSSNLLPPMQLDVRLSDVQLGYLH